jgi:hypothetical protein
MMKPPRERGGFRGARGAGVRRVKVRLPPRKRGGFHTARGAGARRVKVRLPPRKRGGFRTGRGVGVRRAKVRLPPRERGGFRHARGAGASVMRGVIDSASVSVEKRPSAEEIQSGNRSPHSIESQERR